MLVGSFNEQVYICRRHQLYAVFNLMAANMSFTGMKGIVSWHEKDSFMACNFVFVHGKNYEHVIVLEFNVLREHCRRF